MTAKLDFKKLSLQDALDLAILIEQEAQERYLEFVERLGNRYEVDAADFFQKMAGNEAKHAQQLQQRRAQLFKNAPSRVDRSVIWDIEAPDPGTPRPFMSVHQALDLALAAERKAFDFFDEALAHIQDPQVRELFVELRCEEHHHQDAIRRQRAELPPGGEGPDLLDDDIDEPSAL